MAHLAAQAGVRYSLENPNAYLEANLAAFLNVLERLPPPQDWPSPLCLLELGLWRQHADAVFSLYGATKKANELMAHAYSHLYGIPATGLRFFSVYGPWGRPDMAMYILRRPLPKANRSSCSITAACVGISRMWMMSSRPSSA